MQSLYTPYDKFELKPVIKMPEQVFIKLGNFLLNGGGFTKAVPLFCQFSQSGLFSEQPSFLLECMCWHAFDAVRGLGLFSNSKIGGNNCVKMYYIHSTWIEPFLTIFFDYFASIISKRTFYFLNTHPLMSKFCTFSKPTLLW